MTTFIKYLKIAVKIVLFFLAFIVMYVIIALVLSHITIDKKENNKEEVEIFIKTNGIHTDLVMPIQNNLKDWSKNILFDYTISKDSTFKYVGLGWGDRGFYLETPTWADLKFSVAIKATTGLSRTAMHTTFYKMVKENTRCIKIKISKKQYIKLVEYVEKSFKVDENNKFINIKTNANYDSNDAFYEANGSYSLFKTCNTWTNSALKIAEQKHAFWTPTDYGIFVHYR
jgi:uncharacterized protein (TIGR02117 family)